MSKPEITIFKVKTKTKPSYWVTDCTYNVKYKYSYEEKIKIQQT